MLSTMAGSIRWIIVIYVCIYGFNLANAKESPPIIVHGMAATNTDQHLILNCTFDRAVSNVRYNVNWTRTRDGTKTELDDARVTTNINATKFLTSTFDSGAKRTHNDWGIYQCKITEVGSSQLKTNMTVKVNAAPHPVNLKEVKQLVEKNTAYYRALASENPEEGKTEVVIQCNVGGFPWPEIKWYHIKDDEEEGQLVNLPPPPNPLDTTNSSKYEQGKTSLTVKTIESKDRGYYFCVADNKIEPSLRVYTLVRVRGKLRILWPFLVLLGELIALVVIIGGCELWHKRRGKDDEDGGQKSQGSGNASTSGNAHGNSALRQRAMAAAAANKSGKSG